MSPTVITHGCRLNIAESEAMRALAQGQDDLVIVNSCAVTAQAVRDARRAIRRARRERPEARIVVTGCAATIQAGAFAAMPEVTRVLANRDKLDPLAWGSAARAPVAAFADHARAFVAVQNGCDHACTFCIIPRGRGASRSIVPDAVAERVAALVEAGHREVVLTGVDLTSYGADLPGAPPLGALVEHILVAVPTLPRLRLSSLDPAAIDLKLFALLAGEARVMPHVHLSLQAGDDLILKRMRRRHSRGDAIALIARLKAARPDIVIGADLIAGFPTEDAAMAARSLELIAEGDIVFGHIFPYSPRPGTPAARMPQVSPETARVRAAVLRAATAERRARWLGGLVGTTQRVLVERCGTKGHAENFAEVRLAGHAPGAIATVRIAAAAPDHLVGVAA